MADDRMLLILDVDETLIFADEKPLERKADFKVGPFHVYRRPHVEEFLRACLDEFQVAVWSTSGESYLAGIVTQLFPEEKQPVFVWGRERCVRRIDPERFQTYFVKDLKKVRRLGYSLARVLFVDDTPQKLERNYGNAVYVSEFQGDPEDRELVKLETYLRSLAEVEDVRRIEKRGWRNA
ncbi:MAG: HAD family hydrolase [Planctomycetales bacterium]